MGLRVSTNIASINAQKSMASSQRALQLSFAQLSSGSRITKAADDAAGLSISETLNSTVRGYHQAQRNANDGMSMVQVAEGGLGEVSNILTRMRELAVQAASDTISDTERGFVNKEIQQMKNEMERIAQTTKWGNASLLNGESPGYDFQVNINNDEFNDRIRFDASEQNATLSALGVDGFDFSSKEGAQDALAHLEEAQVGVNGMRANLGAIQNRLISTSENLSTAIENMSAAKSRIRDTDLAQSSAELARNNVLMNASVNVLAQANAQPAMALRLLS